MDEEDENINQIPNETVVSIDQQESPLKDSEVITDKKAPCTQNSIPADQGSILTELNSKLSL